MQRSWKCTHCGYRVSSKCVWDRSIFNESMPKGGDNLLFKLILRITGLYGLHDDTESPIKLIIKVPRETPMNERLDIFKKLLLFFHDHPEQINYAKCNHSFLLMEGTECALGHENHPIATKRWIGKQPLEDEDQEEKEEEEGHSPSEEGHSPSQCQETLRLINSSTTM